jgi:cyclophilin family peptidyl-prolyl cis-trans isomerase
MKKLLLILPAVALLVTACGKTTTVNTNTTKAISSPAGALTQLSADELKDKQIRMVTSKGTIVFELYGSEAPIAVSNFITLVNKGFYNGLTFHRYESGFVIQGGDPQGTGTGGPGYSFIDETVTRDYLAGTVAMANAGADTNGSQFFIMLADNDALPKSYTIFGKVTSGMDVVLQLRKGDTMTTVTVEPLGTTS